MSAKFLVFPSTLSLGIDYQLCREFSFLEIKTLRKRIKKIPKKLDTAVDNLKAKVKATTLSPLSTSPRKSGEDIELIRLRKSADINENKDRRGSESGTHETTSNTAESGFSGGKRVEEAVNFQQFEGPTELYRIASNASNASNASRASKASKASKASRTSKPKSLKSRKSKEDLPAFDAPAAAGVDLSDEDGEEDEEMQDDHAFDHPSTYEEQRWIWVPKDMLGLSEILVNELHDKAVEASDEGATMDERGVVEVSRNPPDKTWTGGHDR